MSNILCYYCEKPAVYETPTLGVYVCEKADCKIAYVEDQSEVIDE